LVWLGQVLPASETEVRRWDGLDAWMNKDAEPVSLRKYEALPAILEAAQQWAPIFKAGPDSGIPTDLFDWVFSRCNDMHTYKAKARMVATVVLPIPLAAYSDDGVKLSVVYMQARAEPLLWFYGSPEQKAMVRERFVRRYANKDVAHKNLMTMQWHMTTSSEDLSQAHDAPILEGLKGGRGTPKWAMRAIQKQHKLKDEIFSLHQRPKKKKGEARNPHSRQPMRDQEVRISFNRAFDELMGASMSGPKATFYKNKRKEIKDALSWPFEREEQKAKIKRLKEARFERKIKAIAGPLVWSKEKNRSMANEMFARHFVRTKND
jgi:hypothetical protein